MRVTAAKKSNRSADGDMSAAEGTDRGIDRRIKLGVVGAKGLRQAMAAIGAVMLPGVDRARVRRKMIVKAGYRSAIALRTGAYRLPVANHSI